MNNRSFITMLFVCCLYCAASAQRAELNGDFEKIKQFSDFPVVGWNDVMGDVQNYDFATDSNVVKQGRYSLSIISNTADAGFGAMSCTIPYAFSGLKLELKGFIKTESVTGYAGFLLTVDGTSVSADMHQQRVHGTTNWTEYSLSLPYSSKGAINVTVSALLKGEGKAWFDDLRLYVDGVPIEKVTTLSAELYPAQKDTAFANSSGIAITKLTPQQVNDLALLGQVWGFIKYHHPKAAAGFLNMDAELFRVMPGVIGAKSYKETCGVIEHWIDKLGLPKACPDCRPFTNKNISQRPEYGKIFDRLVVTSSLARKLTFILNNHDFLKSYFVAMYPDDRCPDFRHELRYTTMDYPDAGYRLLCLFRYWNMIQYFYPYKHLIGEDWDNILTALIPVFIDAKNAVEYDQAAMQMICRIHDAHGGLQIKQSVADDYFGKSVVPIIAHFVGDQLVVSDYLIDSVGVEEHPKQGDIITSINGVSVKDLVKKYLPIVPGSNYVDQLRNLPFPYLLRTNARVFSFSLLRNNKTIDVSQQTMAIKTIAAYVKSHPDKFQRKYSLIGNDIGYVNAGSYHNKDLPAMKELFKNTKGLILDMRRYPSDEMAPEFVPYATVGHRKFSRGTFGSLRYPGLFTIHEPGSVEGTGEYRGKVVVIVNEDTQSAGEFITMALQSSPNVTVIGSQTAGADGATSLINLPGGISTLISGNGVLYPDGTETQRTGIRIDIIVKPTIDGVKVGIDEPLEKAKALVIGN